MGENNNEQNSGVQPDEDQVTTNLSSPGEEVQVLPEATLEDLPERLRAGAAQAGWSSLMPVQAKAIP